MQISRPWVGSFDSSHLAMLLLVSFSGVYLTRLGVSPVYISTLLGVVASISVMSAAQVAAPLSAWMELTVLVSLSFIFTLHQVGLKVEAGNVLNFVLGPLVAALVQLVGCHVRRGQIENVAKTFIVVGLLVMTVECGYRLTHPDLAFLEDASTRRDDLENIAFYIYKFNSIMYIDSNFVGLQLAVLFAFLIALARLGMPIPWPYFFWTFTLVVLTISRASIFTCVLLMGINGFISANLKVRLFISILLMTGLVSLPFFLLGDESFMSKFDLIMRFSKFLGSAGWMEVLFGVGVGRAVDVLGIGGHNLVVVYVVEVGLVVAASIFLYLIWLARKVAVVWFLIAAWLVNGFSLTTFAIPYMYAAAAVLRLLSGSIDRGRSAMAEIVSPSLSAKAVQ